MPALMEFRGPDAVRFLNGQLTQDVRLVAGGKNSLPSCVTDAKGRLQFRVWITETGGGALWVEGCPEFAEAIEARLTRYLIADDVEVFPLTGKWSLVHFTGTPSSVPAGVLARECARYGTAGTDWWIPPDMGIGYPEDFQLLVGDELETFRVANGVPAWGRELTEGMLPPEAGLDATDISYQKGCYIGQEVISRIKFAGKLNRRLVRTALEEGILPENVRLVDEKGNPAGEVTSVSPLPVDGMWPALGYVKRGAENVLAVFPDGKSSLISIR
jgi:folate-binding protein YgfZ